jgi:glutathione S-transferase
MAEYKLHCFAQSGNAYRAALMLNLIGADWEPIFVDFFKAGVQRTPEFRDAVNEMGEAPVLVHGTRKLSQSGVILLYLAGRSGMFLPRSEDDRLEALRWIIFDNQKVGGNLGPYRFFRNFARPLGEPALLEFLKGRAQGALAIVDKRLSRRPYLLGAEPTIADVSMTSYLYYPPEEFGFDIAAQHQNIGAWLARMKALPRWGHPYDLMPGHPLSL